MLPRVLTALAVIGLAPCRIHAGDHLANSKSVDSIVLDNCEVEYEETTPIGVNGGSPIGYLLLREYYVKLGDHVKAKQVLGQMADADLRAEYQTSKVKSDSDVAIRLNEAEWKEAILKLKRLERLGQRDQRFVTAEEDVRLQVDAEVAKLRVEMAKQDRVLSRLRVQELEAQLEARKVIAPHDGVVVEFYKKPGQPVMASEPLLHIVNPTLLRVIGHVNVDDYGRLSVGQKVLVKPELDSLAGAANESAWTLEGTVTFIDRRIDPKSKTGTIHAAVKNVDQVVAAGVEVRMEIFAPALKAAGSLKPGGVPPGAMLASAPRSAASRPGALAGNPLSTSARTASETTPSTSSP